MAFPSGKFYQKLKLEGDTIAKTYDLADICEKDLYSSRNEILYNYKYEDNFLRCPPFNNSAIGVNITLDYKKSSAPIRIPLLGTMPSLNDSDGIVTKTYKGGYEDLSDDDPNIYDGYIEWSSSGIVIKKGSATSAIAKTFLPSDFYKEHIPTVIFLIIQGGGAAGGGSGYSYTGGGGGGSGATVGVALKRPKNASAVIKFNLAAQGTGNGGASTLQYIVEGQTYGFTAGGGLKGGSPSGWDTPGSGGAGGSLISGSESTNGPYFKLIFSASRAGGSGGRATSSYPSSGNSFSGFRVDPWTNATGTYFFSAGGSAYIENYNNGNGGGGGASLFYSGAAGGYSSSGSTVRNGDRGQWGSGGGGGTNAHLGTNSSGGYGGAGYIKFYLGYKP